MLKKKVHLCKGCIESLKEYNPYTVPVDIIEVPMRECDNFTDEHGNFVNLKE